MRLFAAASTLAIATSSLVLAGCTTASTGTAPATPAQQALPQIPTQLPRTARPVHYSISAVPDAPNLRFAASILIDLDVVQATDELTLNAADLDFGAASLTDTSGKTVRPTGISTHADAQTATFHFADRLVPGRYRLAIDYSGKINRQTAGLFALDYDSAQGPKRVLYTQFEASDARRFFPSWDEPQFRTPFDLRVTVPAGQMAVSNMPQAGRVDRPDGTSVVTFQTSPAMSSYLLFLGMGEFDRITAPAGATEVGVVTKKGDGEKGRYALESAAKILPYYNNYFGTHFPLPKLDNVAGPGSSQFFGAMENWGAIFSFESILLVDPAITSEARRQAIFSVDAHEMAHQWFGDLVTMAWWNDIWLNEGFASWMATKATDAIHPEWQPLLGRVGGREDAMGLDSVATTHPIVQNIMTVDEINQAFDAITYKKGEAVLTMLEDYVGEDAWRQGVRDYIATYRLKNTVTDNLWEKVQAAAGKPITAIAHDFTLQPGVPLIRVEGAQCSGGKTTIALRQGEFSRDHQDKAPLSWRVPVIASTLGGSKARTLVTGGAGSLTVPGCGPLIVNSGQSGYYRTLYTPALLGTLTANFAKLQPVDQIGLASDAWGLGLAGYQPASDALDLVDAVPANANPELWNTAANILADVYHMYDGDAVHQAMVARYASAKLSPVLNRLGWKASSGELATSAVLRANLIATLGELGDSKVAAETLRRFNGDPAELNGPLRSTILGVVAANLDAAGWDRLHAQAKAEKDPLRRTELYTLLGETKDEALAQRALDLALTDEPGVTNSSQIIGAVAGEHPDLAFDFALANQDKVLALIDAPSQSRFLPQLASGSASPATVTKLQDYAAKYMTSQSRRSADVAAAAIQNRIQVRQTRLPDISRWMEAHQG
jgi:aminopeptidase N